MPLLRRTNLARLAIAILLPALMVCLSSCYVGYSRTGGRVAYHDWNEGTGRNIQFLDRADALTFVVLAKGSYAKDREHVWYVTRLIEGADPESFVVLSNSIYGRYYGKDKNHVYMQGSIIPAADPGTFRLLTFPWSRDKAHVFLETDEVAIRDIESFEVLKVNSITGGWVRDEMAYYYGQREVTEADYTSFQILDDEYAKDKNRVYWWGRPVPSADPDTFEVLNHGWARDKSHRFFVGAVAK